MSTWVIAAAPRHAGRRFPAVDAQEAAELLRPRWTYPADHHHGDEAAQRWRIPPSGRTSGDRGRPCRRGSVSAHSCNPGCTPAALRRERSPAVQLYATDESSECRRSWGSGAPETCLHSQYTRCTGRSRSIRPQRMARGPGRSTRSSAASQARPMISCSLHRCKGPELVADSPFHGAIGHRAPRLPARLLPPSTLTESPRVTTSPRVNATLVMRLDGSSRVRAATSAGHQEQQHDADSGEQRPPTSGAAGSESSGHPGQASSLLVGVQVGSGVQVSARPTSRPSAGVSARIR
jgi:hypothetical protein